MSEKNEYFFEINQIQAIATSAMDSLLSLNASKIFEMKPINETLNINEVYTHSFGYESLFDDKEYVDSLAKWMKENWQLSIFCSLLYILVVFSGKAYMQNRPKYQLRPFLIVWNLLLAVFSICGTIRVWPEFVYTLSVRGIKFSVCDSSYAYGITGFWSFMFCFSKLPELVDTLFVVLRKQELIFLHWYHHATVLIYCWFSYKDFTPPGRWFMSMNYLVHSLMYSYYACKAMQIKVPRIISQMITTGQIIQMVAGCYVNYLAWSIQVNGEMKCNNTDENIFWSSVMYLSYFILFLNFFIQAYVVKKTKTPLTTSVTNVSKKKQIQVDENNNTLKKVNIKKIN